MDKRKATGKSVGAYGAGTRARREKALAKKASKPAAWYAKRHHEGEADRLIAHGKRYKANIEAANTIKKIRARWDAENKVPKRREKVTETRSAKKAAMTDPRKRTPAQQRAYEKARKNYQETGETPFGSRRAMSHEQRLKDAGLGGPPHEKQKKTRTRASKKTRGESSHGKKRK